jgi:membrane-associated protein
VENWILALAATPLVYLGMYLLAAIDGFFPPIPSESLAIALAALFASSGRPNLALVVLAGAAGAFTGDQIAYWIGKRLPIRRLPLLGGPRVSRTLDWAQRTLARRGASFILAARYIPVGRVAVNMTAGAVGYPRRRFVGLTAVASLTWAVYCAMIGLGAGAWFRGHPLGAVTVGVVTGLLIGLVLDLSIRHLARRKNRAARGATRRSEGSSGGEDPTTRTTNSPRSPVTRPDQGPAAVVSPKPRRR